ncbi:class I SAM-dependent methyltransferase [Streptomyces sp. NBC_01261]|uniref:class I SAM-dependent DNA methyltransferase n=1 Tax=Streptomyces sp. NBC_01261 TaxID=2903802 RepID=UPI002E33BAA7|nr:class I SAM-dependent methyltransferase [Streptomyces sp. NBC_01261]
MQYDPRDNFFGDYADIYAEAPYNDFTEGVAKDLPELLSFYGAGTGSYLDLGCGTGTLLIALADRFGRLAGVDQSADMLRHAGAAALRAGVQIDFTRADLREFRSERSHSLVTCTYNTLNYLTAPGDLRRAAETLRAATEPGGLVVLDAHPTWFVERAWAGRVFVEQNTPDRLEVWENPYDADTGRVDTTVTVVSRTEDGRFERVHEVHPQRGHDPGAVTDALVGAGFTTVDTYAGLGRTPMDENTSRVWYVAR